MRIFTLIFILILSACSKKEEAKEVLPTGLALEAIGSINYGGVLLGSHKDAAIRITNYDDSSVNLNLNLTAPFSVASKSVACAGDILGPKSSCIISVRFSPTEEGSFSLDLKLSSAELPLNGVGLVDGYVVMDVQNWDLGDISAGLTRTREIKLTNLGDLTVQTPLFTLPSYITIGVNQCGSFITARKTCKIILEAKLLEARTYGEAVSAYSESGGLVSLNFSAQISPANPAGLITFSNIPVKMSSAGEEQTITSNPIKDSFGNVVNTGTNISVSVNGLLILLDGNSYQTNASGQINFRVRSRTIKGSASISALSSQASGSASFPVTSGVAFGQINIPSVLNEITANGQTQVVLSTQLIYDQYNNIVDDGTEVIFELIGDGEINSGLDKKKRITYTISGIATVTVKAGTTAQLAQINAYSGPILDQNSQVVGYSATGSANLNFVPGPAEGTFQVFPSLAAIYSNTNPPSDLGVTLPTKSRITIGPIKDKFNNIVKSNTAVSVSITNGFNSSGTLPTSQSTLFTDASGNVAFDLIGNSVRGSISITASAALASGSASVWGYLKTVNKYTLSNSIVDVFYKHHSATELPSALTRWAPVARPEAVANQDNFFYGLEKESSPPKTTAGLLPYYTWQCFVPALDSLIGNFCMQPDRTLAPLVIIDANNNFSFDVPVVNPQPELNPNATFASSVQLQNWQYTMPGTDSLPSWIALGGSDGALLIDNTVALSSDDIDDGKRKRQGYSIWIDIEDTKKYVLSFNARDQFGNDTRRALEVGVVEIDTNDPAVLDDLEFDLVPLQKLLVQDTFLATASSNESFRFVYIPTLGTQKVRLYFSTKGRGNGARVVYDNISFKRLDTQNIHDSFVTEGPSIAYMSEFDQVVMFGGSTLEELPGPVYQNLVSDRNTLLSRILDKSSSIIIENFSDNSYDFGSPPSARSHAPMVSVNNRQSYLFGGFDSSAVRASNDLFMYDSGLRKWSELSPQPDLTVLGALQDPDKGKPSARYQHGFAYVQELKRLYVIGGVTQDPELESVWTTNDDVWYVDLSRTPLAWKRVCNACGGLAAVSYINLADAVIRLSNNPNINNYDNYVLAQRNIQRTDLIWNSAAQKFYIHLPESVVLKIFDPYTEQYIVRSEPGLMAMLDGFQWIYNEELGRTYSYKRNSIGQDNSRIVYWDMNSDEKQYVKVRFKLGVEAKTYMQEMAIKAYAYGQSRTIRPGGENNVSGVNFYVFNYQTENWELMANHSSSSATSVPQLYKKINDALTKQYVSPEGYVEAMITPKGRPGINGGEELMGDDLDYVNLGVDFQDNLVPVKQVVTSNRSTCTLLVNGTIKCWGDNTDGILGHNLQYEAYGQEPGQLGNNLMTTKLFDANLPANAGLLVEKIFMGKYHACAVLNNGKAKCWGNNTYGQLGYADLNSRGRDFPLGESLPYLNVGTLDGTTNTIDASIVEMALGESHTCAVVRAYSRPDLAAGLREQTLQNRLKCWGRYNKGQIGWATPSAIVGAITSSNIVTLPSINNHTDKGFIDLPNIADPIIVSNRDKKVTKISAGNHHTCVELEDFTLMCWGDNTYGQLGIGTTTQSNVPVLVNFPSAAANKTIQVLALGGEHSCTSFTESSGGKFTKCWGRNNFGQLGAGSTSNLGDNSTEMSNLQPISFPSGRYAISLALGQKHTCAVLDNDRLVCWGDSSEGQLGYGPQVSQVGTTVASMGDNLAYVNLGTEGSAPVEVVSVISSSNHNCLITSDSLLKCFGENGFGQLGYEDTQNRGKGQLPGDGYNLLKLDYIELETTY